MSEKCQGRHYTAGISSRVGSAVLGSRPDEPFPLWREQPQNGRDQEQGRNIAHEMAVLSTVVKRLCAHDRACTTLDQMVNEMRLRFSTGFLAAVIK